MIKLRNVEKVLLFGLFFLCTMPILSGVNVDENKPSRNMIEWSSIGSGLFSNLTRVLEWMYCVKQDDRFSVYLNMNWGYGADGNLFSTLFKPFNDHQIFLNMPAEGRLIYHTEFFPSIFSSFKKYPTDEMRNFSQSKFVYMDVGLYRDPDFSIFRCRLHPFIRRYFQLESELQNKVDSVLEEMNSDKGVCFPNYKIGIHVRAPTHYQRYNKTAAQFLDDIEHDVDHIMRGKNPKTTKLFLATLLQPIVDRLCLKYHVVVCDMPRVSDIYLDWIDSRNAYQLEMARDAIIDAWSLANCDEFWGGSSNMTIFIGCINPDLKIHLLPSLECYDGF